MTTLMLVIKAKFAKAAQYLLWESDPTLGPVVADIRQGQGHLDMAGDLTRYAVLFEKHWETVKDPCDIEEADIKSAKKLSTLMLQALTAAPAGDINELKDLRNRAGEYLRRGADDIRAAAEYVFRKDPDAMNRYPSLHVLRGPSRNKSKQDEEPLPAPTDTADDTLSPL